MPNERQLALRQIDQARSDSYAISEDLAVIQARVAQLPARKEAARLTLLVMALAAWALFAAMAWLGSRIVDTLLAVNWPI